MAGGSDSNPPPLWLIIITIGTYMAFLLAYGTALPNVSITPCTGVVSCTTDIFGFFVLFFNVLTLGGISSPLPLLIQGPLVLFFAITWGVIIAKGLLNAVGAVLP